MTDKQILKPGPDHPITITADPSHVVVRAAGRVVADTRRALLLREANYPPVHYIAREDIDMALLRRSDTASYCPYKGDAAYYSVPGGVADAAWTYEAPYDAVAEIRGHLAFYPTRVDEIEVSP